MPKTSPADEFPEDSEATRIEAPRAKIDSTPARSVDESECSADFTATIEQPRSDLPEQSRDASKPDVSRKLDMFGEYELIDEIARGGMGVVYRARQTKLNRVVALKMILAGQFASPQEVQRFYTEARAAASLHHHGIVPIFDIGELDGRHYFSMGFIEGTSLAGAVREGPLAARDAADVCAKIADAVAYAHGKGVVHRDLKPGNVLLDSTRQPHVTDFGLAKLSSGDSDLTGTGQVLGTPSYMPPEQAAGKGDEVGPVSDVYSLGAILYFLLSGRPPFQASNVMETLVHVLEREPVSPRQLNPSVPVDLETICLKCLEKSPAGRYAGASGLADELRRFLNDEPILARPVTTPARLWRWCRRNPGFAGLISAIALSLLLGIAVSSYFAIQASERLKESRENERLAKDARQAAREEAANATESARTAQRERDLAKTATERAERLREVSRRQLEEETPLAYGKDIRLLQVDWKRHTIPQRLRLLSRHDPAASVGLVQGDSRSWEWYFLRGLADHSEFDLRGHVSFVDLLEWSVDGRFLASASSDDPNKDPSLRIWELPGGNLFRPLKGHESAVASIAWKPTGDFLASGHQNGEVILWNVRSGSKALTIKLGDAPVHAVTFAPDGNALAVSTGNLISLLEPETLRVRRSLRGHMGSVRRLRWNPTGTWLASSAEFDSVCLWKTNQDEPIRRLESQLAWANAGWSPAIAWHPTGELLACELSRNRVSVFDLAESVNPPRTFTRQTFPTEELEFTSDGEFLAAIGRERTDVWEWRNAAASVVTTSGGVGGWLTDSRILVTAPADGRPQAQWTEISVDRIPRDFDGLSQVLYAVKPAPVARRFATAGADLSVRVWNLDQRPVRSIPLDDGIVAQSSAVALSPQGEYLAVCPAGRAEVVILDIASGKIVRTIAGPGLEAFADSIVWSPDGGSIAVCHTSVGHVTLWNTETGESRPRWNASAFLLTPRFSPDGRRVVVGNRTPQRSPDPAAGRATDPPTDLIPWKLVSETEIPRSRPSGDPVEIRLENQSPWDLLVCSIDSNGVFVPVANLTKGGEGTLSAAEGSVFCAIDEYGSPLGHVVSIGRNATVVIPPMTRGLECYDVETGQRLWRAEFDRIVDWNWDGDGSNVREAGASTVSGSTGERIESITTRVDGHLLFSPRSTQFVGVRAASEPDCFQVAAVNFTGKVAVSLPQRGTLGGIRWSPDGTRLLTFTADEIAIWNPLVIQSPLLIFPERDSTAVSKPIRDANWCSDGKAICWVTPGAVEIRDATLGYRAGRTPNTQSSSATPTSAVRPATAVGINSRNSAFITRWRYSPTTKPWRLMDRFPEFGPDELASLENGAWESPSVGSRAAYVDCLPHLGAEKQFVAGYAVTRLTSAEEKTLRLRTGSDDGLRVWLNGEQVFATRKLRIARPDEDSTEVTLRKGENRLLVETLNGTGACGFYLRLERADGSPVIVDAEGRLEFSSTALGAD